MSDSIETRIFFDHECVVVVWDTGHTARAKAVRIDGPSEVRAGPGGTYVVTQAPVELTGDNRTPAY
jgi:hypothetical protein